MVCTRCSHPLTPRADRCLRCFALNPQNREGQPLAPPATPRPAPTARAMPDPAWAAPASSAPNFTRPLSIASDPPGPLPRSGRFDFRSESAPPSAFRAVERAGRASGPQLGLPFASLPDLHDAVTEPPDLTALASVPALSPAPANVFQPALASAPVLAPAPALTTVDAAQEPRSPTRRARLAAWALDAAILAACFALHVATALLLLGPAKLSPQGPQSLDTWADLLFFARRLPLLWALLIGCLALAYSWLFAALGGRTPGMWLAGLRLVRQDGGAPETVSVARALARAALALLSVLPGAFGFVLALFDKRGQTLHDKLAGCLVIDDSRASLSALREQGVLP